MSHKVEEKLHATLGASTASRWMACPGSVALSEGIPPRPGTIHAQEGTAAHALAELSLNREQEPATFVGTTLEGIEVTDDMAEHVGVFVSRRPVEKKETQLHHLSERSFCRDPQAKQLRNPSVNSVRFKSRPMNTSLLVRASPSFHGVCGRPSNCM